MSGKGLSIIIAGLIALSALYVGYSRYTGERPPYTLSGNVEVTVIPDVSGKFRVSIGVSESFRERFEDFHLTIVAPNGEEVHSTSSSSPTLPFINGSYRMEVSGVLIWRGERYDYSAVSSLEILEVNGSFRVLMTSLKETYTKR